MDASRLERAARALLDAASRIEAETMCVVPRRLVDALRAALAAQPAQAGAYHVVAWAEVHESTGGRHHAAMLMRGEDIIGDFFDPNQAQAACDALNAAEQPAQAGDDAGAVKVVDATAVAICEADSCGYSAGCAGSPSSVRTSDLEWLIAKHATTQPAQAGASVRKVEWDKGYLDALARNTRPLDGVDEPAQAGEAVAWRNVEAALREWEGRVVIRAKMEEAKEGGIAYAREQESRALMVALGAIHAYAAHPTPRAEAASAVPAWRDSFPPTHYCRECRALWRRWPDGSWSLVTAACGKYCDNVPMGEQIAPLASEYPTLRVERPTALATPGEVAPGVPNQAGVTAGETAPPPPSTPASAEAVARAAALNACELIAGNPVLLTSDAVDAIVDRAVAHALRAQRNGGAA